MARIKEEDLKLNILINADETLKKIRNLRQTINGLKLEQKQLSDAGKEHTKEFAKLSDEISKNQNLLEKHQRSLNVEAMNLQELKKYIRDLGKALQYIDPNKQKEQWDKYNGCLRTARKRLIELSQQSLATKKSINKWSELGGFAAFSHKIWQLGKGFLQFISKGVGTISGFEQANVNLATVLGKNVSQIQKLTDSALELGRTTEYTASQVTSLQTELAKLGFNEGEILSMQKSVLNFSTAIGANLPDAAALAGATLRMFGLSAKDSEEVLGTFAVAADKSALSFEYLQTAMPIVGPVAKTFGLTVKDTAALLGTLSNAGFDASSAATATRNIILNLADANGKLAQAIGGPVNTFPELIAGLQSLNTQGVDLASTLELTDKRSVAAFNSFLSGAESALGLRESLNDVDGELERISSERLDTIEGSIKLLQSAWEGLILSLSGSKGLIKWLIDASSKIIGGLTNLIGHGAHLTMENILLAASFVTLIARQQVAAALEKTWAATKKVLTFWSKANRIAIHEEIIAMQSATACGIKYKASTLALSAAKALLTGNIKAARIAMSLLNKTLMANPAGLILAGIMALVGGILALSKATKASHDSAKELQKSQKDLQSEFVKTSAQLEKEKSNLEELEKLIKSSETGSETRKKAIEELNAQYGEYLPNLLSETESNESIATAIGQVNLALEEKIRLRAKDAAVTEVQNKIIEQEESAVKDLLGLIKDSTGKDPTAAQIIQITDAVRQYSSTFKGMQDASRKAADEAEQPLFKLYSSLGGNLRWTRYSKFNSIVEGLRETQFEATKTNAIIDGLYKTPQKSQTNSTQTPKAKQKSGSNDEDFSSDEWSLNNSKTFLNEKANLLKQYNSGAIASKDEYEEEVFNLEVKYLRARITALKNNNKDYLAAEIELQEKIKDHQSKISKDREKIVEEGLSIIDKDRKQQAKSKDDLIKLENEHYAQQQEKFKDNAAVLEALQREHLRNLKNIELNALNEELNKKKNIYEVERKFKVAALNAIDTSTADGIAKRKQAEEALMKFDLDYMKGLQALLQKVAETGLLNGLQISDEELLKIKSQLADVTNQIAESTNPSNKSKEGKEVSIFGITQTEWETLFTNIKNGKAGLDDLGAACTAIGAAAQEGFRLASQAIAVTNAKENEAFDRYKQQNEEKKKLLQARLDAGIISQSRFDEEIAKMEQEEAEREAEMKDKQAKREKAMNLTQAIINTALSVTSTLAQFGTTPWGIAAAAIAAAMGSAEIAMISSQPAGYAEGGLVKTRRQQDGHTFEARLSPDKRGWVQSPTILVGEEGPEYVIPAEGVRNPALQPFLNTIEQARKSGTLRSLNIDAVYPASVSIGRAKGGFTPVEPDTMQHPTKTTNITTVSTASVEKLLSLILEKMNDPIPARVSMLGKGGILEAQDEYNRMKKIGRIG